MRIRAVRLYAKTYQAITSPGYANENADELPYASLFAEIQLAMLREFEARRARELGEG